ncbi:hypothetical protein QTL95_28265 [Rhizobium sp. S152]|uniref:hypothetical protein n=1 Tax=Rhizobium sp. S152 TaxID=3055038 RepID=UPI0025AA3038|nr:hypothetical protein [Rhizobium sp. S152]MDM9629783.1 hypothetical protein [Rhizobium sp. S152]
MSNHYEVFADKPAENSDYEFYTAGFEILMEKPYLSELVAALSSPERPVGAFAGYIAMLYDNKRRSVICEMRDAGLLNAPNFANSVELPGSVDALIAELATGRLASIRSVLEYVGQTRDSVYRIPAFLRVLSAAETVAGSPTAAAHLLGQNSGSFTKVLTRHHVARGRLRYVQALHSWLETFRLPGVDIMAAISEVDRLWFRALREVRENAKRDAAYRRLRGRVLAEALNEELELWRRALDAANMLDEAAGLPLRTLFSIAMLDMACPIRDRSAAA